MGKQVYLFELDSVRKTDGEIAIGQKALYDEIVVNGNTVVLTYNQLVDSRAFFSLLADRDYYDSLIALFSTGKLCVSQFGDMRTVSQYLQNTIEDDKQFIYSALPLKCSQKRLIALMHRSLVYSDLSEIHDYYTGNNRTKEEREDLFVEVENGELKRREMSDTQMREILRNLYWLLSTVLRLSAIHEIYIPPKEPEEYKDLKLHHILSAVLGMQKQDDALWEPALVVIRSLSCLENDNRSVYLREIKDLFERRKQTAELRDMDATVFHYAEAIVNLCYNYACEISICNISKHYNSDELLRCGEMPIFREDFFSRLAQDWNCGEHATQRYFAEETNVFETYQQQDDVPALSQAVRLMSYEKSTHKRTEGDSTPRYEYDLSEQQRSHRRDMIGTLGKQALASLLCVFVACVFALLFDTLQNLAGGENITAFLYDFKGLRRSVCVTIGFLFITEFVTFGLTKCFSGLVSLGDALSGIGRLLADGFKILHSSGKTYINPCKKSLEYRERPDTGVHIDFVRSSGLKAYIQYRKKADESGSDRFADSDYMQLADVRDSTVLCKLGRLEELFHYKFGVAYKSAYNTMLIDPIKGGSNDYYPYERIIPASDHDGVVMVPVHHGCYVLLKQYRHALRKEQYAFPRGFADVGESPEQSALRELSEELAAMVTKPPILLGRLTPDSGLSGVRAYVYQVELDDYTPQTGHEGILDCIEIPVNQFKDWLRAGHTEDGFTLGAFTLLPDG